MRYTTFYGLAPKYAGKAQAGERLYAEVAHNLDLYSGNLRPLRAPRREHTLRDVYGRVLTSTAQTLYDAGGVWVGFDEFTWVVPDPVGDQRPEHFIFVQDGELFWQTAKRVLAGEAPVSLHVEHPCDPPQAMAIVGLGCKSAAPAELCVAQPTGECVSAPPQPANYVYTWVRKYSLCEGREDESNPSPPVTIDVVTGDAVALTGEMPAGVTHLRWYREVAGTEGSIYLFAGESNTATFVDDLCPEELGEPLDTRLATTLPKCLDGVALVGDSCALLWTAAGNLFVSEPQRPHKYDWMAPQYQVRGSVVGVLGLETKQEGSTTYDAHIITDHTPYTMRGELPEAMEIRQVREWYGCVSKHSICELPVGVGYASQLGFVAYSGTDVVNLTAPYMTEREWRNYQPWGMRAAWWAGRVWIGQPDRDGMVMTIDSDGGPRPRTLSTHGVRVQAWHASAHRELHLTRPGTPDLHKWGEGVPLWYTWRGPREVQAGLWKPAAVKIVSEHPRRRYDRDDVYAAFDEWARPRAAAGQDVDVAQFVSEHQQWKHLYAQLEETPCSVVLVLRDGRPVYRRVHKDSHPMRIPRSVRALEWAVQVEGFVEVREVHIQSSMTDLSQEGGMA